MVQSVDLSARQGLVGGGHLDLVIWRSSVSQSFTSSLVIFKCVSSLLHGLFSNADSLSWSSCVKTLVKNVFKTSALAAESVAIVPSLCSKSLILGFVFNFDRAYLKNIFGLVLTSVAIRFSKSRTAFLTSALTVLDARLY